MLIITSSAVAPAVADYTDLAIAATAAIPLLFVGTLVAIPAGIFDQARTPPWVSGIAAVVLVIAYIFSGFSMVWSVYALAGVKLDGSQAVVVATTISVLFIANALIALLGTVAGGFSSRKH